MRIDQKNIDLSVARSYSFFYFSIVLVFCGLFIFSASRGFNFLDEGFYLLMQDNPGDVLVSIGSSFYIFSHFIDKLLGHNIFNDRIFSFILNFCSVVLMVFAYQAFIKKLFFIKKISENLVPTMSLCLIVRFPLIFLLSTPNYNTLIIDATYLSLGFLFYLFATIELSDYSYRLFLLSFFNGILSAIMFFIKFPSAIISLFIFFVLLLSWPNMKPKKVILLIVMTLLGILCGLFCFFHFLQPVSDWKMVFMNSLEYSALTHGHVISVLLKAYVISILKLIFQEMWVFVLLLIPIFLIKRNIVKKTINYLSWFFLLLLGSVTAFRPGFIDKVFFFLLIMTIIVLLIDFRENKRSKKESLKILLMFAVTIFYPFVSAIGTMNPITYQISFSIVPWFLLVSTAIYRYYGRFNANEFHPTLYQCVLFIIFSVLTLKTALLNPYGLYGKLFDQSVVVKIGQSELKVDPTTAGIINDLRGLTAGCGFKSNDPIIALYDEPGLVYALGGRSPACTWYIGGPYASAAAKYCMSKVSPEMVKRSFIIVRNPDAKEGVELPDTSLLGIDVKNSYKLCGVIIPKIQKEGTCCKAPIRAIEVYKPKISSDSSGAGI